jgi:hypothetical protein
MDYWYFIVKLPISLGKIQEKRRPHFCGGFLLTSGRDMPKCQQ